MLSRRLATTGGLASSGDASGDCDVDGASVRAWGVHGARSSRATGVAGERAASGARRLD